MGVSPPCFPRAIHVSKYSRSVTEKIISFHIRGYYPLGLSFPADSVNLLFCNSSDIMSRYCLTTPTVKNSRFGLFPFRSPLLRKSLLVSFPLDTKMFQFSRFASITFIVIDDRLNGRVAPFGDLRIKGCLKPTRSLSQTCYVLLRLLEPRHPPYALRFPAKKPKNALIYPVAENHFCNSLLKYVTCMHTY